MERIVFFAKNTNELLYQLKTSMDLQVVGGCTLIDSMPQKSISIRSIKDLCKIERHERYMDVGPGVTLNELLALGPHHLPKVLFDALSSIANPIIRNMATIGGNICEKSHKMTLFAPLVALDATLGIRNQNDTMIVPIQNFQGLPEKSILTNIRIPLIDGDLSIFKRVGSSDNYATLNSASFAFIASTEKNSITGIRLAFAGPFSFRSKSFETSLLGQRLPLKTRDIIEITRNADELFRNAAEDIMINDVLRQQFMNLTKLAFEQLM